MTQDVHNQGSYERQAVYYDAIYKAQGKDYKKESEQVHEIIHQHKKSAGTKLLDVGCGTGGHFPFLRNWYEVEGLDVDIDMLNVAKKRFPDIVFHHGDMSDFRLNHQFDVITCLFSAVGYTKTVDRLKLAIKSMAQHLIPGGVLVVEPWFSPDQWNAGAVHAVFVDQPELKIARMNSSEREGNVSVINFHFLVAESGKVEHFTEHHNLGLFTQQEYKEAFNNAGLEVLIDIQGITGRGLYIGTK